MKISGPIVVAALVLAVLVFRFTRPQRPRAPASVDGPDLVSPEPATYAGAPIPTIEERNAQRETALINALALALRPSGAGASSGNN